jgi:RNA polymerase sigma-B factor
MAVNPSFTGPAESAPAQPDPAAANGAELGGMDDRELLTIAGSLPHSGDRRAAARDLLVTRHRALVYSCVRRYLGGPESAEDLVQVGYLGLVKAINNFDPAFGYGLSSYARTYILGEIKRHFRDKRWQLHVERPMQELVLHVRETTERLTHQFGRVPADAELAGDLEVSEADIREARRAELVLYPKSLDEPAASHGGPPALADLLGQDDPRLEHMLDMRAVVTHWGELPAREQQILALRFYGDMTQSQVGQHLGMSQMQVSRLLAHALGYLRPRVTGLSDGQPALAPQTAPVSRIGGCVIR